VGESRAVCHGYQLVMDPGSLGSYKGLRIFCEMSAEAEEIFEHRANNTL
jgi:hypothetical protein